MQKITPTTIAIVGGVLVALAAVVGYVENRVKEPEEKKEEYLQEAEDDMDRRFNENIYKPETPNFTDYQDNSGAADQDHARSPPTMNGGSKKTKGTKRTRKTKRTKTKRKKQSFRK